MKIINNLIGALCLILLCVACSKNRLTEDTPSVLTADLLFQTKDGFEYALNGLHEHQPK
jgi:hypothetical protein